MIAAGCRNLKQRKILEVLSHRRSARRITRVSGLGSDRRADPAKADVARTTRSIAPSGLGRNAQHGREIFDRKHARVVAAAADFKALDD